MLMRHRDIVTDAAISHDGRIVDFEGDGCFAAFTAAGNAVLAAVESQRQLASERWPGGARVRVRMGLHTGVASAAGGGYVGLEVHRAARIASAAHGGQILASGAAVGLLGDELAPTVTVRRLGEFRLKNLLRPETLFQVAAPELSDEFPPLTTLENRPHNLPLQPTALIGREPELETCRKLLKANRLLTLTGPGGTGKTRLGLQLSADVLDDFDDGVFFVPLAAIPDAANVPDAIAAALSLTVGPGKDQIHSIVRYLEDLQLLLLLDNFEHVVDAANAVSDLLEGAPGLKVLVTSREPLRLIQEQEYAVPPLALPSPEDDDPITASANCEAMRLFVERAQAVDAQFHITAENASAIAEVCRRLDGLPLAIELAAARMKLFGAKQLLERLEERFKVLVGGQRNLPVRQQTLRNTVDWSYQFLSPEEKQLFHRLAVFAGGFTLEAVESVCAAPSLSTPSPDVAGGVESLLNKSLLERLETDSIHLPRFRMLETIREYAVERLEQDSEAKLLRDAHASFYTGLSEEFDSWMQKDELTREDAVAWIQRIGPDHDNLRSAVEWSISDGDILNAFRIVWTLRVYSVDQGHLREATEWIDRLSSQGDGVDSIYRARVHSVGGMIAGRTGDKAKAESEYRRAAKLAHDAGDERLEIGCEYNLAFRDILDPKGQKKIEKLLLRADEMFRKMEPPPSVTPITNSLGILYFAQGRYEDALAKFEEHLAAYRRGDNHTFLINIAGTLLHLDRIAEAKELFRKVLIQERDGTCSWQIVAIGLMGLAAVSSDQLRAARLLAASDALLDAKQIARAVVEKREYDTIRSQVMKSIDDETYDRFRTQARRLGIEAIIAYALEESESLSTGEK